MTLLASPRRRRRLAWGLGALAAATTVALLAVLLPRGESLPEGKLRPVGTGTETAAAKPLQVTPAIRREIDAVVERFVHSAVLREDLDEAWELASPRMRAAVSRERWNAGDLPVFPFPQEAFRVEDWRLRYSLDRTVVIDVMVLPKPGLAQRTLVYGVELTAYGAGKSRRWLVDTWFPQTTLTPGATPTTPKPPVTQTVLPESPYTRGKLDARWLLVPLGVLTLIALFPLSLLVRGSVRRRQAERRYRKEFGD